MANGEHGRRVDELDVDSRGQIPDDLDAWSPDGDLPGVGREGATGWGREGPLLAPGRSDQGHSAFPVRQEGLLRRRRAAVMRLFVSTASLELACSIILSN